MLKDKNIFLVGFMGSGKSTVGKILSKKTGMNFVDIDELIEKKEKMHIKDIFSKKGEAYFRDCEKREIEEFLGKKGFVVSTGGGLGANIENMKKMKKAGVVVWLDVSLDEVLKRCKIDNKRPLLQKPYEELKEMYNQRKKVYSMADIHINTEGKSPEDIAFEILERINGDIHRH